MRRDYFELATTNVAGEGVPTLDVRFTGPDSGLRERLTDGGETLAAPDVDVAYRLRDDEGNEGVLSVSNRVTGSFIFELDISTDVLFEFLGTVREFDGDTNRYRLTVTADDETLLDCEKEALLVYDAAGELLRQHSLIPSGVEL